MNDASGRIRTGVVTFLKVTEVLTSNDRWKTAKLSVMTTDQDLKWEFPEYMTNSLQKLTC
jgi:hypothetical protein